MSHQPFGAGDMDNKALIINDARTVKQYLHLAFTSLLLIYAWSSSQSVPFLLQTLPVHVQTFLSSCVPVGPHSKVVTLQAGSDPEAAGYELVMSNLVAVYGRPGNSHHASWLGQCGRVV